MAEGGRTGGSSMSPAKWVPYVRPEGEGRERETVLGRAGGGWGTMEEGEPGLQRYWKGLKSQKDGFLSLFLPPPPHFPLRLLKLLRPVGTFPFLFLS